MYLGTMVLVHVYVRTRVRTKLSTMVHVYVQQASLFGLFLGKMVNIILPAESQVTITSYPLDSRVRLCYPKVTT